MLNGSPDKQTPSGLPIRRDLAELSNDLSTVRPIAKQGFSQKRSGARNWLIVISFSHKKTSLFWEDWLKVLIKSGFYHPPFTPTSGCE